MCNFFFFNYPYVVLPSGQAFSLAVRIISDTREKRLPTFLKESAYTVHALFTLKDQTKKRKESVVEKDSWWKRKILAMDESVGEQKEMERKLDCNRLQRPTCAAARSRLAKPRDRGSATSVRLFVAASDLECASMAANESASLTAASRLCEVRVVGPATGLCVVRSHKATAVSFAGARWP